MSFAAPTIQCEGVRIITEDKSGKLHDAGDVRDFVKNYSALASAARTALRTSLEAQTVDFSLIDPIRLKAEMTILKAAGGSIDPVKEGILDTKIADDATKKTASDAVKGK